MKTTAWMLVAGLCFALSGCARHEVTVSLLVEPVRPTCPDGFVLIEAGTFMMGSPASEMGRNDIGYANETQHPVSLTRDYCLQSTEVTQGQWRSLMGNNPSYFDACGDACPVEMVNWFDAVGYMNALSRREGLDACYKLSGCSADFGEGPECSSVRFLGLDCEGYRLPTEAEWEYAARAGTTGARYGDLYEIAWHGYNSLVLPSDRLTGWTHEVGTRAPNAWGLYDMLGNVREWTGDRYGAYDGPSIDPTGASTGSYRVFRGGAWNNVPRFVRAAHRSGDPPTTRNDMMGFRPSRSN